MKSTFYRIGIMKGLFSLLYGLLDRSSAETQCLALKCATILTIIATLWISLNFYQSLRVKLSTTSPPSLSLIQSHDCMNKSTTSQINRSFEEPLALLQSFHVSKDLIVYSAHYDDRPRNNHSTITLMLIIAKNSIPSSNWITGCGVGLEVAKEFMVRLTYQQTMLNRKLNFTYLYQQYMVECYDLKVTDGSRAFVMYKTAEDMTEPTVVESERPVMIPAPRVKPTGVLNFTVATCTKAYNRKVTYLPEFVRYQKTVGVDHVHMTIMDDFISDGGFEDIILNDSFLKEEFRTGYLSFTVWKNYYSRNETYDFTIGLQQLNCFYRFRGTYDYVVVADTDDFFTPRIPGKTKLKYYIQEHCIGGQAAGSCRFQWRWLYPDVCGVTGPVGSDGNVTAVVTLPQYEQYAIGYEKSVHSTKAVVDFRYHNADCDHCMLPKYQLVDVSPNIAYFAHNRLGTKNDRKVCQEKLKH